MNSELIAAQALLDLQGDRRYCSQPNYQQCIQAQPIDEMDGQSTISKLFKSLLTSKAFKYELAKKNTCEVGTQTDFDYGWSNIEGMERVVNELQYKIQMLESQLKNKTSETLSMVDSIDSSSEETSREVFTRKALKRKRFTTESTHNESPDRDSSISSRKHNGYDDGCQILKADSSTSQPLKEHNCHRTRDEMVTIGDGSLRVPAKLLKKMDWSSYTNATRKLLSAVFPRHILATHSLTGKRSPAFPDKPAKKKLDPALVNDIVQIVVEKCNVPENAVRTSITTKCADESKMHRTRQMKKKKRKTIKKENLSPSDYSDDSDF